MPKAEHATSGRRGFPDEAIFVTSGGPILTDAVRHRSWYGQRNTVATNHLPKLRAGGVVAAPLQVEGMAELIAMLAEIDESNGATRLFRDSEELLNAVNAGVLAFTPVPSFAAVQDQPDVLSLFRELGARFFAAALNMRNKLVDGCGENPAAGLSIQGRRVVERLCEFGYVIDVSHVSEKGFWDIVEIVDGPILASHSNAQAVNPNKRNLTDAQIDAVAESGGCIGLSAHASLLRNGDDASIDDAVRHLTYIIDRVGHEHVCLGADFVDYMVDIIEHKLAASNPDGTIYNATYKSPRGIETVASLGEVLVALREQGVPQQALRCIAHENMLRLYSRGEVEHSGAKKGEAAA